jgi:hypothetical protein
MEELDPSATMGQPGMQDLADSIKQMVQGLSLEEVSELFSKVFTMMPGGPEVMQSYEEPDQDPEPEQVPPPAPGKLGRHTELPRQGKVRLPYVREDIIRAIKEVLVEWDGEPWDPTGQYDVLDHPPPPLSKQVSSADEHPGDVVALLANELYDDRGEFVANYDAYLKAKNDVQRMASKGEVLAAVREKISQFEPDERDRFEDISDETIMDAAEEILSDEVPL